MVAGQLKSRVQFESPVTTPDGGGGSSRSWGDPLRVWGQFKPERGAERVAAGRLESAVAGTLRVRSSSATRAIGPAHSVLIDGQRYQVRSVTNPDRRGRFLEMTVEGGVAT